MAQPLDSFSNLQVVVDMPSLIGRNEDIEDVDQLLQLDVHFENGCLKILSASPLCQTILAPMDTGLDILSRIAESGKFMSWLTRVDDLLMSNSTSLPIQRDFTKMHFTGSQSSLCYCADVSVLLPEAWRPTHKVLSLRLWPTGRLPHELGIDLPRKKRRSRKGERPALNTMEAKLFAQIPREVKRSDCLSGQSGQGLQSAAVLCQRLLTL